MSSRKPFIWLLPLLSIGFALRVAGLSELQLSGDAAWTVYLALKSLPELTHATAIDSHPPFYYYLLHYWMGAAGVSELSVRFLSAFTGLLTVAVIFKVASRLLGTGGGLLAGLLAAMSPFLVYFDRMPRMYSLLALLSSLALYLVLRLMKRPSRLYVSVSFAVVLTGLYTHYYGIFIMAAGFLAVAVAWRDRRRMLLAWAGGHMLVLLLFVPWLAYALGPSVSATTEAYGNIELARPANVLTFLARFWVALNVGDMIEANQSHLLAGAVSLLWIAGLVVGFRRWRAGARMKGLAIMLVPASFVLLPLAANVVTFIVTPYVPFTRLLLLSTPAYLVLLAWVISRLWKASRPAAGISATLALAVFGYSLAGTFYVERYSADAEAVEVARRVAPISRPEDAVIFQAIWHAGYFSGRAGARPPAVRVLAETPLTELPGLVERHPRLWLSMFATGKREARYPQEEWLDTNAYKAAESWEGRLRLSLYGGGPDPALKAVGADFGKVIRLDAAGVSPGKVRAGDVVRLYLRWKALQNPGKKYVVFAHMVDEKGRRCTGQDGEPVDGIRPTETWKAGEVIDDRRGLLVGPEVPPGLYFLSLGLYVRDDSNKRLLIDGKQDRVVLGPLEVLHQASVSAETDPVATAGVGLELLRYQANPGRVGRVVKNVDNPIGLWLPASLRAGSNLPVTLHWRARKALSEAYRLRLEMVDGSGNVMGRAPERFLGGGCPRLRWAPGEVISDALEVAVQQNAPPGRYRLRATLYPQQGNQPAARPMVFGSLLLEDN